MSRYGGNDNYDFETDIEIDVDVDLDLYSDVDVDINGNLANFNVDVEAIGDDTFVELNLAVLTTDNLSMITASGTSAVG